LTLLFAPEFAVASEVARWQSIGVLFRVLAYPFGYGLLACGRAREFIRVEIFSAALHLTLLAAGLKFFGFKGAGLAYAGGCAGGMLCTYLMTRKPFAFTWSPTNRSLMTWTLVGTTAAYLCTRISSPVVATASASLLTVLAIVLSTLRIRRLLETRSGLESHVANGRTEHPSQPL
jgi:PST family polysaccharide transporter